MARCQQARHGRGTATVWQQALHVMLGCRDGACVWEREASLALRRPVGQRWTDDEGGGTGPAI